MFENGKEEYIDIGEGYEEVKDEKSTGVLNIDNTGGEKQETSGKIESEEKENPETKAGEQGENDYSNLIDLLNSPLGQMMFREGAEALIKNLMLKAVSKEIASKSSEFLAESLLRLNDKDSMKDLKKVRGRKKRKLLEQKLRQRAATKEELKKLIEKQLMGLLR